MGFCSKIDGKLAISSSFVYIMGLEPLQLNAVIRASTPPKTVSYTGQIQGCPAEGIELSVVSWRQVGANMYNITAYNEPYFWKLRKMTIEKVDVEVGVSINSIKAEIEKRLDSGWVIEFSDLGETGEEGDSGEEQEAKDNVDAFAFVDFSGSVLSALDLLQELTGTFACIDHINKKILFSKTMPEFEVFKKEGEEDDENVYIIERAEGNLLDTEEVVVFGNLNRPSEPNKNAIDNIGIDGYKDTEIVLDVNSWSVDSDVRVDSYTDKQITSGEWSTVKSNESTFTEYSGAYVQTKKDTFIRSFEPIITAATNSITQDEVVDYDIDETELIVTEEGEQISVKEGESAPKEKTKEVNSKYLKFEYMKPNLTMGAEEWAKITANYFASKDFKCAPVTTQENAEELASRAVEAIHLDISGNYTQDSSELGDNQNSSKFSFGAKPKDTVYMFPFRNFTGAGGSRLRFSVSCFLVSAMMTQRQEYHKVYRRNVDSNTGEVLDSTLDASEPPTINTSSGWLAEAFKIALLQYLKITWTFTDKSMRVKFPYAVNSSGTVFEPSEDFGDNVDEYTLIVQNNFIANIDRAANKAKLLKEIANLDLEEGWLNNDAYVNFKKVSRFTEVFSNGDYKAVQYIRKEGES